MDQLGETFKETQGKPILIMKELCKSYQLGSHELRVLRDINLTIQEGEIDVT